ncbi:energy transducer TonB [Terricaulis sp.]|uniref:energy transducer TonB n=1 Tax=Terricaulis sp. TaxID=2768686 RepID=UPI003783AA60
MTRLIWSKLALTLLLALLVSPAWAQKVDPGPPLNSGSQAFPVAVDPPPAPPTLSVLTNPFWVERPDAGDFARNYPQRALDENVDGRAILDCLVAPDGRLACMVVTEEPEGYGFGEASLRVARSFRMAPLTRDGAPTAGGRVRVPIRWQLAD